MYSLYIKDFVDPKFASGHAIDHELIANEFMKKLQSEFSDSQFEDLLIVSGFIPDLYAHDSSEETLYTKLIEALVCEWARRVGASGQLIKQKASYEDVKININNKIVVCDAKSFRLGRSQSAPNAKDFLKLEDIRKWMSRYSNAIGGLVTYPCKHEWATSSDVYQYCSTKDAPTLMLPYKYLALLLHYKSKYKAADLLKLWDYDTIFPDKIPKKITGGNKKVYWNKINSVISTIISEPVSSINSYVAQADTKIATCVAEHIRLIELLRDARVAAIISRINAETNIDNLKNIVIDYQIKSETGDLEVMIERIKQFRK